MEDERLVNEFVSITGCNIPTANFYLESSLWKLDDALERYYDTNNDSPSVNTTNSKNNLQNKENESTDCEILEEEINELKNYNDNPLIASSNSLNKTSYKNTSKTRIVTISSLKKSESEEESEDDSHRNKYYAGGSVSSGQQIIGPNKLADKLYQAAKSHTKKNEKNLKNTQSDTVLKLYKNGFLLDDVFFSFIDPKNVEYIKQMTNGQIPIELSNKVKVVNGEAKVILESHKNEEYIQEKHVDTFTGSSYQLKNDIIEDQSGELFYKMIPFDNNSPSTSISFKLPDGRRVTGLFNQCIHTICDLKAYLRNEIPELRNRSFNLFSSVPSKLLSNKSSTLGELSLLKCLLNVVY